MSFRRGHLRYFVTVVEERQITRAAAKLHIAQPALSHAMAQLEAELGVQLLERHARGVTPTTAGARLYEKARIAVAASQDARETARSLARSKAGTVEFGFIGAPPGLDSPHSLAAFTEAHPAIQIRYRDLPFPTRPTSSWIADVDIAVCHAPPADPTVWRHPLHREPRMVLAPAHHPAVAGRTELAVADVLDEEFISLHPGIDAEWAGFWSLDDHRGAPPQRATLDHAANPGEVLAALSAREAITTAPAPAARVIANVLPTIAAVAITDATESSIMLVGHKGVRNPLVETVLTFVDSRIGRVD
jgi:DNA-binding transcriptional LysR family regulator